MDFERMLDNSKEFLDDVIGGIFTASLFGGIDLDRETIEAEFQAVGLYVAGADNDISNEEVDLLNYLFDMDVPIEGMAKLIPTLKKMYNSTIEQLQMPGWLVCKAIDEAEGTRDATDKYIEAMSLIMNLFTIIDGDVDASEEKFIENFVNRLKRDRDK